MKTTVKLTKLECENILTNAEVYSCIGYWVSEFITVKYSPIKESNYRMLSIKVKLGDDAPKGFENKTVTIDHKTIQKGIKILFSQDGYDGIKSDVIEDDSDIETTDVIIQFGLFGEQIYA